MALRHKSLLISIILFMVCAAGISPTGAQNPAATGNIQAGGDHSVAITSLEDGMGLSATVQNLKDTSLQNLQLSVDAEGGTLVMIPKKTYDLPTLQANASASVHLRIFGIGLGVLTGYPNITITVTGPSITPVTMELRIRLLGSFIKILIRYPDPDASSKGYTLFSPEYSQITYLLDPSNTVVHTWENNYIQGIGLHLLENGDLLRTGMSGCLPFVAGGQTGCVEILDWNSTVLWHYVYSEDYQHCLHHEVRMMPNGNVLMIAWEYKTMGEAVAAGRNPLSLIQGQLWPDHIIEVKPTGPTSGDIVWEWHVWDHLIQDFDSSKANYGVVADHPELVDINYLGMDGAMADWTHTNAIDYNETYDQILLSVRDFGEIWVIDHSTTTAEAAGHTGGRYGKGGDLLYRWGNPQTYHAGTATDQKLFGQHNAQWIPSDCPGAGDILVFNNGMGRPQGQYSTVDELAPPRDSTGNYTLVPGSAYGPQNLSWQYVAPHAYMIFSMILSGVQRLPNGNTLICSAMHGIFYEVTPDGTIVWQYTNGFHCVNQVYYDLHGVPNVKRYPLDYPGVRLKNG